MTLTFFSDTIAGRLLRRRRALGPFSMGYNPVILTTSTGWHYIQNVAINQEEGAVNSAPFLAEPTDTDDPNSSDGGALLEHHRAPPSAVDIFSAITRAASADAVLAMHYCKAWDDHLNNTPKQIHLYR